MKYLILIGLLVAASSAAKADLIFSQAATTDRGAFSNIGGSQLAASSFTLAADATLGAITWTGNYQGGDLTPGTGGVDFLVSIMGDAAGKPDNTPLMQAMLTASVADTGTVRDTGSNPDLGAVIYDFSVTGLSVDLTAGTRYWLAVMEDDPATGSIFIWTPALGGGEGRALAFIAAPPANWVGTNGGFAFDLFAQGDGGAAIPVPASALLLGAGFALPRLTAPRR